jgi:hypothetical protein
MKSKKLGWLRRFMGWLFGAPFQELPLEFGDPVPPELRAFQAKAEETQHRPRGRVTPSSKQAKPPHSYS